MSAGFVRRDTAEARAYLASVVPLASGSVDRIEQVPSRLAFLFEFDPARACADPGVQEVLNEPGARDVDRGARPRAGRRRRASTGSRSARPPAG